MVTCGHLVEIARLQLPRLSQSVHREECTQCFDNQQDHPLGIDVCLTCFNGGCLGKERHHARTHVHKTGHGFSLNIKRKLKPSANRVDEEEPPAKMTKLAIVEDRDEDKYEFKTVLKCWKCEPENGLEIPDAMADPHENLWLCLTCGSLGCGRQQYGGLGGNGHGLQHYQETRHPISVKLGTITPEGNADIYCYICNDAKQDPDLAAHLTTFGINVQTQTKTEKSMTELQIEHNLKFDFSLTDESGKALEPVFGPGLTGLSNLGNSCYMASVLQTVFSLPVFRQRYYPSASTHWETCTETLPASCVDCQMHKLADGLLSGRYSHPRPTSSGASHPKETNPLAHDSPTPIFQEGVRPSGFKALIGKGHEEFSTMRQQDSEEFFTHLLTVLRRYAKKTGGMLNHDPTEVFAFGMEQRLECGECRRVRYRVDGTDVVSVPVPARETGKNAEGRTQYAEVALGECLDILTGTEALEYTCPGCQKRVIATKRSRFATFPQVLMVHAKKFQLVNWVPTKLDIPLNVSDTLQLDQSAPGLPQFNEAAMAQLEAMGFPTIRCQKALLATGNNDAEAAMEWLFAHMEDPATDIDAPIQAAGSGSSAPEPSQEQVSMLSEMGFTHAQARKALRETGGDAERAVEWLFSHPDDNGEDAAPSGSSETPESSGTGGSAELPARYRLKAFISHKGPSVHSGHYVAHIRVEDAAVGGESWVLFNDEKVVKADEESVRELKKLAYLYVYERE
ncbi:hypothetical protein POSPLADRAFT_1130214 [Postia placenta MAD-698-R-SB12]|uniref:Ubiquitin carboxyl-terminal hydrolase n=1 Tax=Postia placenta MAD-698-R-SB12 TaxID=670580 RepID=A0A1X6NI23_9APHY|nr:hypothetical protein POSPLADRAFT_1130214 [Postia placenta MAD-698-R-SB12]OSX68170.1 hypothetical protein POSPLADRAFT_1130214 [Postia placenta MAD-698-R-SB12]